MQVFYMQWISYMHLPPLVVFSFFCPTAYMNSLICTTVNVLTYQATQLSLFTLGLLA